MRRVFHQCVFAYVLPDDFSDSHDNRTRRTRRAFHQCVFAYVQWDHCYYSNDTCTSRMRRVFHQCVFAYVKWDYPANSCENRTIYSRKVSLCGYNFAYDFWDHSSHLHENCTSCIRRAFYQCVFAYVFWNDYSNSYKIRRIRMNSLDYSSGDEVSVF